MKKLQISIKNKINSMFCSEHSKSPDVKILDDKISFDCCCDSFKNKTEEAMLKVTKEFIESQIKNVFKGN